MTKTTESPAIPDSVDEACQHKNRKCVYASADGDFERWQCMDCGELWGVEIAQ